MFFSLHAKRILATVLYGFLIFYFVKLLRNTKSYGKPMHKPYGIQMFHIKDRRHLYFVHQDPKAEKVEHGYVIEGTLVSLNATP